MVSVEAVGLVKKYGDTAALDRLDLSVEPGELFFLLGPSGCGKTTLLRAIAGFCKPEFGKIYFDDDDVSDVAPHKREAAMVFQSYALWPHMTVAENVAFGLRQQGLPGEAVEKRTAEALDMVQLLRRSRSMPNELSGGQQQRVALARALAVRPKLLLLDEPLSNLDARLRSDLRMELRRICKESELTAIYVTHDQQEALCMADRIAVMDKGRIVQLGEPLEIYKRPVSRFVAQFIGVSNFLSGKALRVGGGFVLVKTLLGRLQGVASGAAHEIVEGAPVVVSIRPESVRLDQMPTDENCFEGKIGETVFYGERAEYTFVSNGVRLRAHEQNPRFLGGAGGESLYAWMSPEDVVVLNP